jgi:hypothetical protein
VWRVTMPGKNARLARVAWMRNLRSLEAVRRDALSRLRNPYDPVKWPVSLAQAQFYRDYAAAHRREAEGAGWKLP